MNSPIAPPSQVRPSSRAFAPGQVLELAVKQAEHEVTSEHHTAPRGSGGIRGRASALLAPVNESGRLFALDSARVIATLGVMWTHVVEGQGQPPQIAALGRFGTSFYIVAAVFLSARGGLKRPDQSFVEGLKQRSKRLLLPFVVWSAIYAAYYSYQFLPRGTSFADLTIWWGPFAGCARHLWFLPFAFFAGTIAAYTAPRLARLSTRQIGIGTLLLSAAVYWYCYEKLFFQLNRFWAIDWHLHRLDRWIEELPLMVLSIGISSLYARVTQKDAHLRVGIQGPVSGRVLRARYGQGSGIAAVLLTGFISSEVFYFYGYEFLSIVSHSEGRFIAHLGGLTLLSTFLLSGPRQWMVELGKIGRFTYFAFLVHVLLIDWLNNDVAKLDGFGTIGFAVWCTLALMVVSASLGAFVRRMPGLRWLTP